MLKRVCKHGISVAHKHQKWCFIVGRGPTRMHHSTNLKMISRRLEQASYSTLGMHRSLHTTVVEEEILKFRRLSESWWDENGAFQALHSLNDLRIPLIRDGLVRKGQGSGQTLARPQPLTDSVILDVGCGGGILSEPLARLGARVTGIDAALENIEVAQQHASHDPLLHRGLRYMCITAEELLETERGVFDAVVASEVLEHVSDVEGLVATCSQLTKPGGSIFFTTINKTWLSYALAVIGAEDIARVVPHGTHDWTKFIPPDDLQRFLEANDCNMRLVHGMILNPITMRWSWGSPKACNYAIHAIKNDRSQTDFDEIEETQS
ncbi:ubiquinone biosynthesis O-methyltransferase, mitochondrial-like isoform X1 [Asterias rubens]|uniref:ubiquinone biosynthesis O-methyltransferase, mitochondrial-like isoform X1 n=2 Tax=Asterias rubens TaxID=7604 RepID=UPI001455BC5E|nr:ubiquinone biosynthesis O-methyltransferase, mitochondrial-like isoform X1 [Asterias rubens]